MSTDKEQTLLERIKNAVAIEKGYDDWGIMENWFIDHNFPSNIGVLISGAWKVVCERYAREVAKDSLERAAETIKFFMYPNGEQFCYPHVISYDDIGQQMQIDKSSITSESNIVIK